MIKEEMEKRGQNNGSIVIQKEGEAPQTLTNDQIVQLLQKQQQQIKHLIEVIKNKDNEIRLLNQALSNS